MNLETNMEETILLCGSAQLSSKEVIPMSVENKSFKRKSQSGAGFRNSQHCRPQSVPSAESMQAPGHGSPPLELHRSQRMMESELDSFTKT